MKNYLSFSFRVTEFILYRIYIPTRHRQMNKMDLILRRIKEVRWTLINIINWEVIFNFFVLFFSFYDI